MSEPNKEAPIKEATAFSETDNTPNVANSTIDKGSEKESLDTIQVVVFKLEDEEYASPILDVQEIIPTGDITPFPN